ncbi:hypothetical protein EIP91_000541 [Steccherinum ochraceum]|uniref:Fungal-type protein kinase domain-containing protein n=1 Tax=Steccherinum ochraceum TaxID=92696 RepID=A0A4R0RV06_9APHY|nr:hypothetical protein EIP91_000541 [Steccherinum ochraceum]
MGINISPTTGLITTSGALHDNTFQLSTLGIRRGFAGKFGQWESIELVDGDVAQPVPAAQPTRQEVNHSSSGGMQADTARHLDHTPRLRTRRVLGWTLSHFMNLHELVTVIKGAIQGHRDLYFTHLTLHRNINRENILICPVVPTSLKDRRGGSTPTTRGIATVGCLSNLNYAIKAEKRCALPTSSVTRFELRMTTYMNKLREDDGSFWRGPTYNSDFCINEDDEEEVVPDGLWQTPGLLEMIYCRLQGRSLDIFFFLQAFWAEMKELDRSPNKMVDMLYTFMKTRDSGSDPDFYRKMMLDWIEEPMHRPPDWKDHATPEDDYPGTLAFMSGEILHYKLLYQDTRLTATVGGRIRPQINCAIHDLEAFFWVLMHLCITCTGPGENQAAVLSEEDSTFVMQLFHPTSKATLAATKATMFAKDNGWQNFSTECLGRIQPYFKPLTGLLEDWWKELNRAYYFYDRVEDARIHDNVLGIIADHLEHDGPFWDSDVTTPAQKAMAENRMKEIALVLDETIPQTPPQNTTSRGKVRPRDALSPEPSFVERAPTKAKKPKIEHRPSEKDDDLSS